MNWQTWSSRQAHAAGVARRRPVAIPADPADPGDHRRHLDGDRRGVHHGGDLLGRADGAAAHEQLARSLDADDAVDAPGGVEEQDRHRHHPTSVDRGRRGRRLGRRLFAERLPSAGGEITRPASSAPGPRTTVDRMLATRSRRRRLLVSGLATAVVIAVPFAAGAASSDDQARADAGIAAFGTAATDAGYIDSGVANDDADPLDLSTDTETRRQRRPARRGGCVRSRPLVAGRGRRHPDRRVGPVLVEHVRLHRSGRDGVDRPVRVRRLHQHLRRRVRRRRRPPGRPRHARRRVRIAGHSPAVSPRPCRPPTPPPATPRSPPATSSSRTRATSASATRAPR